MTACEITHVFSMEKQRILVEKSMAQGVTIKTTILFRLFEASSILLLSHSFLLLHTVELCIVLCITIVLSESVEVYVHIYMFVCVCVFIVIPLIVQFCILLVLLHIYVGRLFSLRFGIVIFEKS